MNEKDLKRISRLQLLEMLVEQGKEVERLKAELEEANEKLNNRNIQLNEAGSIAEASLKLNNVFEDAQKAADQYLESIKIMEERQQRYCSRMEAEIRAFSEQKLQETLKKCTAIEKQTREYCDNLIKEAEVKAQEYRNEI